MSAPESTPIGTDDEAVTGSDKVAGKIKPSTKAKRRRRGPKDPAARSAERIAQGIEDTETGSVHVLGRESEEDRLARIHCRIRTKQGTYLYPLTDRGNSERFLELYGGRLKFVAESGVWRHYNGLYWADTVRDRELHVLLGEVLRDIWHEATQVRDPEQASLVRQHAALSEGLPRIKAAKELLTSECATKISEFDPRTGDGPDLLNLQNGTLNLSTFELQPHRPTDMLAKICPVAYDPAATAPNWLAHLEWAIPDEPTRETVQRYLGYCLTTETREQKMLCFYGHKGRNGKGVIVRAVEKVMGYDSTVEGSEGTSYSQAATATLLMAGKRSPGAAEPEMARLVGKRFVSLSETGEGNRFDDVRLKMLTGGDAVSTRLLHRNTFQFTPVAKYVLLTNHRPEVHGDDPAVWRRLLLVNFPHTIDDAGTDADPHYEDRIQAELPGILNWMLEGLRKWRESGLQISDAIRHDTAQYRADQDLMGQFFNDTFEQEFAHLVRVKDVYALYREWCETTGQRPAALQRFKNRFGPKVVGFYTKKTGNPSQPYYGGLRLRPGVRSPLMNDSPNPIEMADPGEPPAEHLEAYAALQPDPEPKPEPQPEPEPEPEQPLYLAIPPEQPETSPLCVAGRHDECSFVWCDCGCHDRGDWPDDDVDPDLGPGPVYDVAYDELGDIESEPAPVENSSEDPGEPEGPPVDVRTFTPWTVKPSAYVDLSTAAGVVDGGKSFEIQRRGRGAASLADLLSSLPEQVKYVHLTGGLPGGGDASTLDSWAYGRLPRGWKVAGRAHDSDDQRDRISFRYTRPGGTQVTLFRSAIWVGDHEEAETSPADLAAAMELTTRGVAEVFGSVCAEPYNVPIKSTPAATGLELISRTLPKGKEFPQLSDELQHLIRSHGGQARQEDFSCETHHSRGAYVPDEIPGLYIYDMKFCYAKLLDLELPCGPVEHDTVPEFAWKDPENRRGWIPCFYRIRVRVPEGWDSPGRFRTRAGESKVWIYPDQPGESFETYAWEHSLIAADRDGWRIGEHIEIVERWRFTGAPSKPLATFGRHLRELRDGWIPAQTDASDRVRELARIMARQITIAAIGKLSGTLYDKLHSVPLDDLEHRAAGAWKSADGKRWEWRERTAGRTHLRRPEWSSRIWSGAREWLFDHPAQPGVGLRHVPRSELIAARTDAIWTSTPLSVTDTGTVGHFRPQLEHAGVITTPRTMNDLLATRRRLEAAR